MAKPATEEKSKPATEEKPVELFGIAEVRKGQWAVVKVVIEGDEAVSKEVVFQPEGKEEAFGNLKIALVRWRYGYGTEVKP